MMALAVPLERKYAVTGVVMAPLKATASWERRSAVGNALVDVCGSQEVYGWT